MAWVPRDAVEAEFLRESEQLPDRVVGIVAPVMIDERLKLAIQVRWNDCKLNKDASLLDTLFRDGGAMGSFDTRIRVAFAIGIYGPEVLKDLREIIRIRNMFAHRMEARDFTYDPIRSRVNNLTSPERFPASAGIPFTEGGLETLWLHLTKSTEVADTASVRGRFLRAVEIILSLLLREEFEGVKHRVSPVF